MTDQSHATAVAVAYEAAPEIDASIACATSRAAVSQAELARLPDFDLSPVAWAQQLDELPSLDALEAYSKAHGGGRII